MRNKITYLTLLIALIAKASFAQYAWTDVELHLKNGKILKGEGKLTMMSAGINLTKEKLKFRSKNKKNKSKHTTEEVDYAIFTITYKTRVNGERIQKTRTEKYIPVYLNKKQTKLGFVELMVEGNLRLVGRTVMVSSGGTWVNNGAPGNAPIFQPGYMGSHNQVMFLKKGKMPEVFNNSNIFKSFKKRAMKYFKDCPALVAKLENKEFVKDELQDIVRFYNTSCN
jgi:ribosome-associated translation inhibitor RaiA